MPRYNAWIPARGGGSYHEYVTASSPKEAKEKIKEMIRSEKWLRKGKVSASTMYKIKITNPGVGATS